MRSSTTLALLLAAAALVGCPGEEGPPGPGGPVADTGWPSAEAGTGSCGPSSCVGCCSFGTCVAGTDDTACGVGGMACQLCAMSEQCLAGSCQPGSACGPASCAGCCNDYGCQPGTTNAACGTGGGACQDCGSAASCQLGVCVPDGGCDSSSCSGCCAGGVCKTGDTKSACGSGGQSCDICNSDESCTQGSCQGSSASGSYQVIAVKGVLDPSDAGCDLPKAPDKCDMYFKVKIGSQAQAQTTLPVMDSSTAQWDEVLTVATAQELADNFDGVVSDYNKGIIPDTQVGQCCPKSISAQDLSQGSLELTCRYKDNNCSLTVPVTVRVTVQFKPL